jgi:hypothetical protein
VPQPVWTPDRLPSPEPVRAAARCLARAATGRGADAGAGTRSRRPRRRGRRARCRPRTAELREAAARRGGCRRQDPLQAPEPGDVLRRVGADPAGRGRRWRRARCGHQTPCPHRSRRTQGEGASAGSAPGPSQRGRRACCRPPTAALTQAAADIGLVQARLSCRGRPWSDCVTPVLRSGPPGIRPSSAWQVGGRTGTGIPSRPSRARCRCASPKRGGTLETGTPADGGRADASGACRARPVPCAAVAHHRPR